MTMVSGHELFIAICPSSSTAGQRDLMLKPSSYHRRLYNREPDAWEWLHEFDPNNPKHPGFVLEVQLDQLFSRTEGNSIDGERRFVFHERMLQEHASLAQRWQDGRASTVLDGNDLEVLRRSAEAWLASWPNPVSPADEGLASVLRALIGAGKLGGGR